MSKRRLVVEVERRAGGEAVTARWLVPSWSKTLRAHLTHPHPLNHEYEWWACGPSAGREMMLPDDGRERCKRCEAAKWKAKVVGR